MNKVETCKLPEEPKAPKRTNPELKLDQAKNIATTNSNLVRAAGPRLDRANKRSTPQARPSRPTPGGTNLSKQKEPRTSQR